MFHKVNYIVYSLQYESEREFSKHGQAKMFTAIFCAVVKHKIDHR